MSDLTRPALRYHGGKWRIAPWIISHFPAHRIYTEAFAGAASVLLRKPRSYAEVYNDLDGDIVNLFRVLRDFTQASELARLLHLTPYAREEFVQSYQVDPDPIEQARRTVIRSFMGFGSASATGYQTGFRANSSRSNTTPAQDWMHYPEQIPALVDRLQGVVIENRPAIDVIWAHDQPDTLHYVDPPYVFETRYNVNHNGHMEYRHEMTDDNHRELAECLKSVKGVVVLSGYGCDLYDDLYADWRRVEKSALADGAVKRTEVLWISPNSKHNQPSIFQQLDNGGIE